MMPRFTSQLFALTLAGAAAGPGLAQTSTMTLPATHVYELVVTDPATSRHVFEMEPGGCLRGPLKFFDIHGRETFALEAGTTLPSGCETDSRK